MKFKENKIEKWEELRDLVEVNRDKRVCVVGTTCVGKSTFLKHMPTEWDMDSKIFPALSPEDKEYVSRTPWTPDIGQRMMELVRKRVKIESGHPHFGTVVLDSDLIIHLTISDELLKERAAMRNVNFEDARNMEKQIKEEIAKSGIPVIEFNVG